MLARQIIEEAPGDWSITVNGEFIGYARTEQAANAKANAYAHNLLSKQPVVAVDDEPLEDLFGATCQSSLTMTVLCPECCSDTHTVFTYINGEQRDYRKCSSNAAHARVRVA